MLVEQENISSLYMWGDNEKGQLGLNHLKTERIPVKSNLLDASQIVDINCGQKLTFVISSQNEIMISGKLPFTINSECNNQNDLTQD